MARPHTCCSLHQHQDTQMKPYTHTNTSAPTHIIQTYSLRVWVDKQSLTKGGPETAHSYTVIWMCACVLLL